MEDAIKAVIQKVVPGGNHGPFAIATSENIGGSITFSLEPTVWQEDEWPEQGTIVILCNLRRKRAGWRAKNGRFLKPSDEQIEISNQERRKEIEMKTETEKELREMIRFLKNHYGYRKPFRYGSTDNGGFGPRHLVNNYPDLDRIAELIPGCAIIHQSRPSVSKPEQWPRQKSILSFSVKEYGIKYGNRDGSEIHLYHPKDGNKYEIQCGWIRDLYYPVFLDPGISEKFLKKIFGSLKKLLGLYRDINNLPGVKYEKSRGGSESTGRGWWKSAEIEHRYEIIIRKFACDMIE